MHKQLRKEPLKFNAPWIENGMLECKRSLLMFWMLAHSRTSKIWVIFSINKFGSNKFEGVKRLSLSNVYLIHVSKSNRSSCWIRFWTWIFLSELLKDILYGRPG